MGYLQGPHIWLMGVVRTNSLILALFLSWCSPCSWP